jgi:hypothetical protein
VPRFALTIEGPNWSDSSEIELSRAPTAGDPITTKYGPCLVTSVEPLPDSKEYAAMIVCRFP